MSVIYNLSTTPGAISNKVAVIKLVRNLSSLGLKEAKDLIDDVMSGYTRSVDVDAVKLLDSCEMTEAEIVRKLAGEGVTAISSTSSFIPRLREVASDAILAGEDGLAYELLTVIRNFSF